MEQQQAPAKANREYKSSPLGDSEAEAMNGDCPFWTLAAAVEKTGLEKTIFHSFLQQVFR